MCPGCIGRRRGTDGIPVKLVPWVVQLFSWGDFEVLFFSLPLGGRWLAEGQTDEGTGFGLPFVERTVQLGFALRGEFLFHVEKEPKDARGSA